jgi:RNA polymerase sigma-70 factor, ECF subfamily
MVRVRIGRHQRSRKIAGAHMNDIDSLIRSAAEKNHAAFTALYTSQQPIMCRYATGLLAGDRDSAMDAVDEAFLDIWRFADRYTGSGSAEGWMRRIVRNKVIDGLRRQREKPSSDHALNMDLLADPADDPYRIAEENSDAGELRACLERLSIEHREVVWLCYFEEKPLAEIAVIAGCPENTVKTRLFHARRQLAKMLAVEPA